MQQGSLIRESLVCSDTMSTCSFVQRSFNYFKWCATDGRCAFIGDVHVLDVLGRLCHAASVTRVFQCSRRAYLPLIFCPLRVLLY